MCGCMNPTATSAITRDDRMSNVLCMAKNQWGDFQPLVNSFHSGPAGIPYGPPQSVTGPCDGAPSVFPPNTPRRRGSAAAARHTPGSVPPSETAQKIVIISETAKFPAPNSLIPNTMPSAGGRGAVTGRSQDSHRTVTGRLQDGHARATGRSRGRYGTVTARRCSRTCGPPCADEERAVKIWQTGK